VSNNLFTFDPADYAEQFEKEGYVHIRGGVSEAFYRKMVEQVEQNMQTKRLAQFAIGDKQQAMYEFPDDGNDYVQEVCDVVAGVTGLPSDQIVLSERHVKAYEADAAPDPKAHKDRFASEISLGLSVHVRDGSTLVLYPYDELDTNPFNSSGELRASLSEDRHPEAKLNGSRRVEIKDAAGDVIMFRGHKIRHLRSNPANTTMLYLKLNTFNCDPLGEDRRTEEVREATLAAAAADDEQLSTLVPLIGRRVDYVHRRYSREWEERIGVVLWGEKHFTIDEDELALLQAIDGERTVGALVGDRANGTAERLEQVRRLARRGVIDLVPAS
jgi:hypothetical protein